ncbi:rab2a member ras oncogene family [Anaeramoeba flamelloides]|uniref:Rab2a member ras oncogene family n=1 Tax=Anaeramoeba flamelloides TaxID=1746091 RepID=A0AAV7YB04_9EUKA|nr:rab2a member ras oncogene family [Anaeramoeba flamelloides]
MSTDTIIFKYIVVGEMGTGKTSLWNRFIDDETGTERFLSINSMYFRDAVCTFLVYDVSRRKSFNQLTKWLNHTQNLTNPNSLILLIGNKIDLEERVVSREEAEEFAQENNLLYTETSTQTGENVNDAFMDMTKKVYELFQEGKLKITKTQTENKINLKTDKSLAKDDGICC